MYGMVGIFGNCCCDCVCQYVEILKYWMGDVGWFYIIICCDFYGGVSFFVDDFWCEIVDYKGIRIGVIIVD